MRSDVWWQLLALSLGGCHAEVQMERKKFTVPELTEEESRSDAIPEQFRCSSCQAVMYQIQSRLERLKPKEPKSLEKSALREQAVKLAETLEEACNDDAYSEYGIKDLMDNAGKVLTGPGIESEQAGIIQGGGKWPKRLTALCRSIVEDEEEEAIASSWRKGTLDRHCDKSCGKAKLSKKRKSSKQASQSARTSSSTHTAPRTGLEELPEPPYEHKVVDAENISLILEPPIFHKFALVLFFDTMPRSAYALACWEHGARMLKKEGSKDLQKAVLARYNSSAGDTWGYSFQGPLPKALLYRKGYRNPKKYNGQLDGPQDLVAWMKEEVAMYMKDDTASFPRKEL